MKSGMKKTAVNTALWTTLALTMGLSACSSEKEEAGAESGEVLAVDRVDDAAELARKNGPKAEDMNFPETAPMPAADATADAAMSTEEGAVAADGSATDATASPESGVASAADNVNTDTSSTEMPAADAATTKAEPMTN